MRLQIDPDLAFKKILGSRLRGTEFAVLQTVRIGIFDDCIIFIHLKLLD